MSARDNDAVKVIGFDEPLILGGREYVPIATLNGKAEELAEAERELDLREADIRHELGRVDQLVGILRRVLTEAEHADSSPSTPDGWASTAFGNLLAEIETLLDAPEAAASTEGGEG